VIAVAVAGLAFGTIRGQQQNWKEPVAFVSLGIGAAAAIAFPILMKRSAHPLVPLHLFTSRNFTVTNISTFLIYGALYVTITFQGIFLIATLGYNEPAAGFAGVPGTLLLALFSTRFGRLAARYGPRLFMALGPAIMGLGLLYFARIPSDSEPWVLGTGLLGRILPPGDYFVDLFPGLVVFGIGLMIMVAPLTTCLMTSVPRENAGVASAINNAISRVGSPLVVAVIFVAVVSSFYGAIRERVPGVDVDSPRFREQVAPLNPPDEGVPRDVVRAAREASTDAFHLAMMVGAGLLFAGAAINAVGIRNPTREAKVAAEPVAAGGPETSPVQEMHVQAPAPTCVICEEPLGADHVEH
jgi:hypothetical protein